jgi:hypothetical protein
MKIQKKKIPRCQFRNFFLSRINESFYRASKTKNTKKPIDANF